MVRSNLCDKACELLVERRCVVNNKLLGDRVRGGLFFGVR